jgi:hypothetical protein
VKPWLKTEGWFLFAPLREKYFSFGDISRKGAKAYLRRNDIKILDETFPVVAVVAPHLHPL